MESGEWEELRKEAEVLTIGALAGWSIAPPWVQTPGSQPKSVKTD
jgi:hypothetical protein